MFDMSDTTPAGTITGLLIGTDDSVTTVEVPLSTYTDGDYTETGLDRRRIAEILGCQYVEHFPVKYPASDPDGIGALCDENGRIYGEPTNRLARKVIAAINGVTEAEIVSLHGNIILIGWTRGNPQDVSLGADQIEEIERIVAATRDTPDEPDTEAQIVIAPWDWVTGP